MQRRIAINGFGRIGRLTFRSIFERHSDSLDIVAINDPAGTHTDSLLLEFDSNYGRFRGDVVSHDGHLHVNDKLIRVLRDREWSNLPWGELGVHTVLECSGQGVSRDKAEKHLQAGARQVIISAPGKGDDVTIVLGVNEHEYQPDTHQIISNGSCTTNCLTVVAYVLKEAFGLKWGLLSTVHSYTNSQHVQDRGAADARECRASALNIIPTTTGAAKTLPKILPELAGSFDGMAFRVPTPTVSVIDFVCETETPINRDSVNEAFRSAARDRLKGILDYCERPLVSMDFKGDPHSAIVDGLCTMVVDNRIAKVLAWYDNEWGYSCRLSDIAAYVARRDRAAGVAETPSPKAAKACKVAVA
ncbi:MAG TPA: type I glyceraldehyde-3-phosphate dehydrogenase [Chloroflexota bacterium]|nr:type I glyceraldehyde-3-phosphate dehydrogenase [Chloroflexota bacterium]